ncbi:hypothetical protein DCO46_15640 [Flavobacterium sp. HTF]|nr:hypothetical protein DCO46_15640 [Flavobacterium sp. HTF]
MRPDLQSGRPQVRILPPRQKSFHLFEKTFFLCLILIFKRLTGIVNGYTSRFAIGKTAGSNPATPTKIVSVIAERIFSFIQCLKFSILE